MVIRVQIRPLIIKEEIVMVSLSYMVISIFSFQFSIFLCFLQFHQLAVGSVEGQQLLVCALLHYLSVVHDHYQVGILDG